jgi:hypothetical protein
MIELDEKIWTFPIVSVVNLGSMLYRGQSSAETPPVNSTLETCHQTLDQIWPACFWVRLQAKAADMQMTSSHNPSHHVEERKPR